MSQCKSYPTHYLFCSFRILLIFSYFYICVLLFESLKVYSNHLFFFALGWIFKKTLQVVFTIGLFSVLSEIQLSELDFLVVNIWVFEFIIIWGFVFCCYLSHFFFFSFVTERVLNFGILGILKFCHNSIFWVCPNWVFEMSQFEFLSSVPILVKFFTI